MNPPARPRWKRRLGWTAVLLLMLVVLYGGVDFAMSPFAESRLLGGKHPELIVDRKWHPRAGNILVIRDDTPSDCNCPLHQMLRGEEVVSVGWSRFAEVSGSALSKGKNNANRYEGRDLAPWRLIIIRRADQATFQADLIQQWDPFWTLKQIQNRIADLIRSLSR